MRSDEIVLLLIVLFTTSSAHFSRFSADFCVRAGEHEVPVNQNERGVLFWFWIPNLTLLFLCANSHTQPHTHACLYTQCASVTQQTPPSASLSPCLCVCVCVPRPPDMQEFEHELYIATQQPSSEPCSQTNNGQHDNSIMKWATWPSSCRGAVTLDICISMMPGLMVVPLRAAHIKTWSSNEKFRAETFVGPRLQVEVNW